MGAEVEGWVSLKPGIFGGPGGSVFRKDIRADIIFSDPYWDFIFCSSAALASVSASKPGPVFPSGPGCARARVAFLDGSNPSIYAAQSS